MTSNTPAQDYDDIVKAIQPYFDGARTGEGDAMKPAFHADAMVYGYLGDTLVSGPSSSMTGWIRSVRLHR